MFTNLARILLATHKSLKLSPEWVIEKKQCTHVNIKYNQLLCSYRVENFSRVSCVVGPATIEVTIFLHNFLFNTV